MEENGDISRSRRQVLIVSLILGLLSGCITVQTGPPAEQSRASQSQELADLRAKYEDLLERFEESQSPDSEPESELTALEYASASAACGVRVLGIAVQLREEGDFTRAEEASRLGKTHLQLVVDLVGQARAEEVVEGFTQQFMNESWEQTYAWAEEYGSICTLMRQAYEQM